MYLLLLFSLTMCSKLQTKKVQAKIQYGTMRGAVGVKWYVQTTKEK